MHAIFQDTDLSDLSNETERLFAEEPDDEEWVIEPRPRMGHRMAKSERKGDVPR